jgi:hypothetical protein
LLVITHETLLQKRPSPNHSTHIYHTIPNEHSLNTTNKKPDPRKSRADYCVRVEGYVVGLPNLRHYLLRVLLAAVPERENTTHY